MTYPETLFELLEKYYISVPIVQRDYVQGSNESIIKELLDDIKNAIVNKAQLGLNFVYGKTDEKRLIPLDGQQRLTTLFLLHLFACREISEKDILLKKFSYETRRSSREFFQRLCEHKHRIEVLKDDITPSDAIKDAIWFHSRWEYDPTIKSALICLDKIATLFRDVNNLIDALESTSPKPIVFNFIPMTDMGMEDSLYIKLNARGRALTSFETYKVELLSKVENQGNLPFTKDDFAQKLDTTWSKYFWDLKPEEFDNNYRNFFSLIFGRLISSTSFVSSSAKFQDIITNESLCEAYYSMEYLVSHTHNEITQHLRDCITKESPSYSDRIIFSAIGVFLGKSKNNIDDKKLGDWFRVISNLTINTTIERPMIYISARNTLDSLGDNCLDILEYMASKKQLTLTGFSPDQINEECVKANLILMGYADIITNAEKHPYFSGQIRSGLNMAELTLDEISSYSDSDIKNRIEKFSEIWSRIADLFGKTQPKNGSLLRASLLSFGDYMPSSGQYLSFCVDRPDEPTSLKALFTSGHKSVIALIDKLLCIQHDTVNQEMQKIVDDKMKTLQNTDWRYWVLKYSDRMFGYLSDSYMRICSLNGTYLLVSKYASSSHCRELFTFALWLELKGANKNASLPREYGRDADYRVVFENKVIRYLNGHFEIMDSSGTIIQTMDIPATINAL